jgi:hypothetical protein
MNTIYNELSKEFGIVKTLSNKEIIASVESYSLLSKEDKDSLILNSRRPNRKGFILD